MSIIFCLKTTHKCTCVYEDWQTNVLQHQILDSFYAKIEITDPFSICIANWMDKMNFLLYSCFPPLSLQHIYERTSYYRTFSKTKRGQNLFFCWNDPREVFPWSCYYTLSLRNKLKLIWTIIESGYNKFRAYRVVHS